MEVDLKIEVNGNTYRLVDNGNCKKCAFNPDVCDCPIVHDIGVCDAFDHEMMWEKV